MQSSCSGGRRRWTRSANRHGRDRRGDASSWNTKTSSSRSAPSRACCPSPGLRSTASGSTTLQTRSVSATTSCAGSRPPQRVTRPRRRRARAHVRLRRRRLCRRGGARRTARSRHRRAALLPHFEAAPQRWVLVDAAPKILAEIPTRLGEYAAELLGGAAIEIHVSTRLESAEAGAVTLGDGSRIPTRTLVWTAGVRPSPAARPVRSAARRARAHQGRLVPAGRGPDERLGARRRACVPNAATPDPPDPPTSQHALRQARRLARNLTGTPKPYRFRMLGQVATLGRYKGIARVYRATSAFAASSPGG